MKLHREGTVSVIIAFIIAAAIPVVLSLWALHINWVIIFSLPFFFIFGLILWFFRVPSRNIKWKEGEILSPADGKIVAIEEITEGEFFYDKRMIISIFMSPLNVHVQHYPIQGEVTYVKYHKGKYLVAWHPKSSTLNERNTIVVKHPKGEILFRQIAGAMARRIKCYARKQDSVSPVQQAGFIKFGSRVDVILPMNAQIKVQAQQKVKAAITVLAEW
jgi:phosphatidylserine decarboxylase